MPTKGAKLRGFEIRDGDVDRPLRAREIKDYLGKPVFVNGERIGVVFALRSMETVPQVLGEIITDRGFHVSADYPISEMEFTGHSIRATYSGEMLRGKN